MKNNLGQLLKNKIRGLGLTTEQAAEKLKISRPTLYKYFDQTEFDEKTLKLIRSKLKIDITSENKSKIKKVNPKVDYLKPKYIPTESEILAIEQHPEVIKLNKEIIATLKDSILVLKKSLEEQNRIIESQTILIETLRKITDKEIS
jgi:transcriptional regulator with XRE-family HTH domain